MQDNTAMEMMPHRLSVCRVELDQYSDKLHQIARGIRARLEIAGIKKIQRTYLSNS